MKIIFKSMLPGSFMTLCAAAVMLSACEMKAPSYLSASPIEVHRTKKADRIPALSVTKETTNAIARNYANAGEGPIDVTVTYISGGDDKHAFAQASRIAALLRSSGIEDVNAYTLPVDQKADEGMAIIDYSRLSAQAPANCQEMPGLSRGTISGNDDGIYPDYRFGCGVDSMMAQQIAHPKDLTGPNEMSAPRANRSGAQVGKYNKGDDYKDLKGTNASEGIK